MVSVCAAGGSRWASGSASARYWSSAGRCRRWCGAGAAASLALWWCHANIRRRDDCITTPRRRITCPHAGGSLSASSAPRAGRGSASAVLCAVPLTQRRDGSRSAQSRGRHRSLLGLRGGGAKKYASISTHASLSRVLSCEAALSTSRAPLPPRYRPAAPGVVRRRLPTRSACARAQEREKHAQSAPRRAQDVLLPPPDERRDPGMLR